jgi:hypothetical protein
VSNRDAHRRPLARAERGDDIRRHLHSRGRLAVKLDDGVKLHM